MALVARADAAAGKPRPVTRGSDADQGQEPGGKQPSEGWCVYEG
jgi:hypothetical protein